MLLGGRRRQHPDPLRATCTTASWSSTGGSRPSRLDRRRARAALRNLLELGAGPRRDRRVDRLPSVPQLAPGVRGDVRAIPRQGNAGRRPGLKTGMPIRSTTRASSGPTGWSTRSPPMTGRGRVRGGRLRDRDHLRRGLGRRRVPGRRDRRRAWRSRMEALTDRAAKLPKIELGEPRCGDRQDDVDAIRNRASSTGSPGAVDGDHSASARRARCGDQTSPPAGWPTHRPVHARRSTSRTTS